MNSFSPISILSSWLISGNNSFPIIQRKLPPGSAFRATHVISTGSSSERNPKYCYNTMQKTTLLWLKWHCILQYIPYILPALTPITPHMSANSTEVSNSSNWLWTSFMSTKHNTVKRTNLNIFTNFYLFWHMYAVFTYILAHLIDMFSE